MAAGWAGIGVADAQDHDLVHWSGSGRRARGVRAIAGGPLGGRAIEVPGLGALNNGAGRFTTGVSSVSCASADSCTVGGDCQDGDRHVQGFVAVEKHGVWGQAIEVPGLGALNKGGNAGVSSVSCASPGNCAAGGYYTDGDARQPGFVVSEKNGRWGRAVEVPGLAALNQGSEASDSVGVVSVSCGSAGELRGWRGP